jgi:aminomethyltransferase
MIGTCPPPRPHYGIQWKGQTVSEVASGTLSPSLGCGIGMAYLPVEASTPGTALEVEIRGKMYPAEVVKKPFYTCVS